MKPLPLLLAAVCVISLSGCSSAQNEAPCKDFESTYNSVHLRDKLIVIDSRGADYRPSLQRLADTARAGALKASGDVKSELLGVASGQTMYESSISDPDARWDAFLDARGDIRRHRDKLVEACRASGYPIQLEPDYAVR